MILFSQFYHRYRSRVFFVLLGVVASLYQNCAPIHEEGETFGSELDAEAMARFNKAKDVLETNCNSCHSPTGAASFLPLNFENEYEFLQSGAVVAGKPDASKVLTRMKNYAGPTQSNRNMPPVGEVSQSDYEALKDWITKIGMPTSPAPSPYDDKNFFTCTPNSDPGVSDLKPLLKQELFNVYRDLTNAMGAADANAVYSLLLPKLNNLPNSNEKGFSRFDDSLTDIHVQAQYDTATLFAKEIAQGNRILSYGDNCLMIAPPSETCVKDFIAGFGLKAFRRPLKSSEVVDLFQFYNDRTQSLEDLIGLMLMSPQFLYHLEVDGTQLDGRSDLLRVTPYELASRLSFHFWQSMPNAELFQAAADGKLSSVAGVQSAINDILLKDSDRVKGSVQQFFKEWLHYDQVPQTQGGSEDYKSFARSTIDPNNNNLKQEAIDEIDELINHSIWVGDFNFSQTLTTDISFAKGSDLAAVYQLQPWDGSPNYIRFPANERSGLLTRAAFLISSGVENNPIHKGVKIRTEVLCDELPPFPEDFEIPMDDKKEGLFTTRQRVHDLTSGPNCAGCHGLINPLGFAFEQFDPLGRLRKNKTQDLYDGSGNVKATLPTDHFVNAKIFYSYPEPIDGALELSSQIAKSGKADACISRKYFQYTYRRLEDGINDDCGLQQSYNNLGGETGSLKNFLLNIATQKDFLIRKVGKQ